MNLTLLLVLLMLLAVLLSFISLFIVIIFFLKTNTRMKSFFKSFKLYCINSWVEKVMKHEEQYDSFDTFFQDYEKDTKKVNKYAKT